MGNAAIVSGMLMLDSTALASRVRDVRPELAVGIGFGPAAVELLQLGPAARGVMVTAR